jgi:ABC-type nitrate/sulfonate/bicarbonate transport system ATPase subunit
MLTRLIVRNFKMLDDVEIELGQNVVFIGPNNSGKTTALQALALWQVGLARWLERRTGGKAKERTGVTINRNDLIAIPIPDANLLWANLKVRESARENGKQSTQNIFIQITVEGTGKDGQWQCGLEFYYANDESFYVRPINGKTDIPEAAKSVRIAFLPPMSGLAAVEPRWEPGRINVLIGEGQTAQVLRNLCHQLVVQDDLTDWRQLQADIQRLFLVEILPPEYLPQRGELTMQYKEPRSGVILDVSASGRGLQQTLLLLAYLYTHKNSVLLLDEPDAHLEVLRQRQIYQNITQVAASLGSQIIAASHSEIVLEEAAERDIVMAFVGKPHRINDRGSHLQKALRNITAAEYYQAEQTGWVLYLEGSTDLAILQAFAKKLKHPVSDALGKVFVKCVINRFSTAEDHFNGLWEAKPDLQGVVLLDHQNNYQPKDTPTLKKMMWQRREIENYLSSEDTLMAFARSGARAYTEEIKRDDLFSIGRSQKLENAMRQVLEDRLAPAVRRNLNDPWWINTKMSDDFLAPLFADFYEVLGVGNQLLKTNYHILADFVPEAQIDPEIAEKLDAIWATVQQAEPRGQDA